MEINKQLLTLIILGSVFGGMLLGILGKLCCKRFEWTKKNKNKGGEINIKIGCFSDDKCRTFWDVLWHCLWKIFWLAFWGIILTKILLWLIG